MQTENKSIGTLYIVGTPIGNLGDFSPRAVEALESCDFIAAEDTRVTLKLLNRFEIKKPMVSYHEHNRKERGEQIAARLMAGENCCLVTDAGMPAVSDPGEDLVDLCHNMNIPVAVVPGPCAFVSALALSGMSAKRFTFEGFLSTAKPRRREHLEELKNEKRTMCFYEAPHKLLGTLKEMAEYFGDRRIALVREITKIHEEVIRTTLFAAIEKYESTDPKGEYVIIVDGAPKEEAAEITLEQAVKLAQKMIENGCSTSEAAKQAAKETSFKKSDIYKMLID